MVTVVGGSVDIELFREFVVLASSLNYREASEQLNVSLSALSKHIKALEDHYGTQLFHRSRQKVAITAGGAMLLDYAQQIWELYEQSKSTIDATMQSRPLILTGVVDDPGEHDTVAAMIRYLNESTTSRPVRVMYSASFAPAFQLQGLLNGKTDCFVSYNLDRAIVDDRVALEHIRDIPLDIIVPSTSLLVAKPVLKYQDLIGATFVQLTGPHYTPQWRLIESLLQNNKVPYTTRIVPVSNAFDYLNANFDNTVFAMPRIGQRSASADTLKMTAIPVDEADFTLSLDAVFLKDHLDETMQQVLRAL